jgi:hypothetical protein
MISRPADGFTQFEAALSLFGGLPPDDVLPLLEQRRNLLHIQIKADESTYNLCLEQGLPEVFIVELDYRITMRKAEFGYVEDLVGRIRERKLGGLELWETFHSLTSAGDEAAIAAATADLQATIAEKTEKWRSSNREK